MEQKFVLEFSHSQNCFHVHSVNDMIKINALNFLQGKKTDFVPIFIGPENEVQNLCETLKTQRNAKLS